MTDDRQWNHAVVVAQKSGRQVTYSTANGSSTEDAARDWLQRYSGKQVRPGEIVHMWRRPPQCVPNRCGAKQAVGERRSGSSQQRKPIQKLRRPTRRYGKLRPRKRRVYAHFGWPRKRPTRILQIATPRQRGPVELRRAGAFQDLRPQVHPNPSKGLSGMSACTFPTGRARSSLAASSSSSSTPLAEAGRRGAYRCCPQCDVQRVAEG